MLLLISSTVLSDEDNKVILTKIKHPESGCFIFAKKAYRDCLSAYHSDNPDKYDCAYNGDNETVEVESCYSALAKEAHDPSSQDGAHNTNDNVHQRALLGISLHNNRSDPSCNCPKNDP